jgi:hypothetical protein
MVDYNAIQKFLTQRNIHFSTVYTKAHKPVKAVIMYLPGNISAEDTTIALQETDYEVISIKHKKGSNTPPSPSS